VLHVHTFAHNKSGIAYRIRADGQRLRVRNEGMPVHVKVDVSGRRLGHQRL
jgi:hypothetical protein